MTNNIRVFLWLGLALAAWLNYSQWQQDYGPKPVAAAASTSAVGAPKPSAMQDTVPQAPQSAVPPAAGTADSVPSAPAPTGVPVTDVESAGIVEVSTDQLVMQIDLKGGTLVRAELPGYPLVKGQPDPVVLFNRDSPTTNYLLQSGLAAGKKDQRAPSHLDVF